MEPTAGPWLEPRYRQQPAPEATADSLPQDRHAGRPAPPSTDFTAINCLGTTSGSRTDRPITSRDILWSAATVPRRRNRARRGMGSEMERRAKVGVIKLGVGIAILFVVEIAAFVLISVSITPDRYSEVMFNSGLVLVCVGGGLAIWIVVEGVRLVSSMTSSSASPSPGWYANPEPNATDQLRYWNGHVWTDHTVPHPDQLTGELLSPPAARPPTVTSARGATHEATAHVDLPIDQTADRLLQAAAHIGFRLAKGRSTLPSRLVFTQGVRLTSWHASIKVTLQQHGEDSTTLYIVAIEELMWTDLGRGRRRIIDLLEAVGDSATIDWLV